VRGGFETELDVAFGGTAPQYVSSSDATWLEDLFQESYNNLTIAWCDPFVRRIANVQLSFDEEDLTESDA